MFWDKYFDLCSTVNKSPNAVAKEIGISSGALTGWKRERKTPYDSTIKKVADYFGVPMSYFAEDKKSPPPVVGSGNAKIDEIIRIASGLSSEDVEKLIAYAEGMRDAGRNN